MVKVRYFKIKSTLIPVIQDYKYLNFVTII